MRAGEVARQAGVNVETLRFYERRGLMPEPDRSLGGHRLYGPEAVTRLRVVRAAQRLGFTLAEVADLLDVGVHRHRRRADPGLSARIEGKLEEVRSRIEDLRVVEASLQAALTAGCADLETCAGSDCCPIPFPALAVDSGRRPPQP